MPQQEINPDTVSKNKELSTRRDSVKYSVSNYQFNLYDDVWILGHDKYFHIDVSCLNLLKFGVQQRIRKGLAKLAENKPVYNAHQTALRKLVSCIEDDIDIDAIKRFIDLAHQWQSDAAISMGKMIMSRIAILSPELYYEPNVYLQKVKMRKHSLKHLDPERGCLNEREELLILNAIDRSGQYLKTQKASRIQWRNHLMLRLVNCTFRRPVQLVQLKWSDLGGDKHPLTDTYHLKMPLSKQQATNPFREAFESSPVPILKHVYDEIIHYRNLYFVDFDQHLISLNIKLSEDEKSYLFPKLPIFPEEELFDIDVNDTSQLFTLFKYEEEIYHLSRDKFKTTFRDTFLRLNLKSVRAKDFYYGINRQKHTVGSKLGVRGEHDGIIAGVLGHTTTKAVEKYCDITPEMMQKFNNSISAFERIALTLQGQLIQEKVKGKIVIFTTTEDDICEIGNGDKSCKTCELERPYSCYSCPFFRPIIEADHESIWEQYLRLYQLREKAGATEQALQSMRVTLQYIAATITACKSAAKQIGIDNND
ncbi:hypothetical protein EYS14_11285 [Alteromonadaceae bacterium M269]|nr:hypothetical protein EYS14_11285 [Alteromonadaceae bacterium M269]